MTLEPAFFSCPTWGHNNSRFAEHRGSNKDELMRTSPRGYLGRLDFVFEFVKQGGVIPERI
ncbi:hypothetical protein RSAG8_09938, partial [Rhizoctonia solani AG-8 WAC10335]